MWSTSTGWRGAGWSRAPAAPGGAYVGPGDTAVAGTAYAWYGLRAYKNSVIGQFAVRLSRLDSPSTVQDFATQSDGGLNATDIANFLSGTTGKVVTLYDQTGGGRHLTQATDANRPLYNPSAVSGKPGVQFVNASSTELVSVAGLTPGAIPGTVSAVLNRTTTTLATGYWGGGWYAYSNTANNIYANGSLTPTTFTANTWHTLQVINNAASSDIVIDGVSNTGTGSSVTWGGFNLNMGIDRAGGADRFHEGFICELGIWASDDFTGKKTATHTNQRNYWGTV